MLHTHQSSCCGSGSNSDELKKIRLFQLILVLTNEVGLEIGLFYLRTTKYVKTFTCCNLNRIAAVFAFVGNLILITIEIKKKLYKKNEFDYNNQPYCENCQQELKKTNFSQRSNKSNFLYMDFLHSFAVSSLYLTLAFWIIVDIPNGYVHHVEVLLKIYCYFFDLFITLLYAKSSVILFSKYELSYSDQCPCDSDEKQANALVPSCGETFSESEEDENLHSALLTPDRKTDQGQTYTMFSTT